MAAGSIKSVRLVAIAPDQTGVVNVTVGKESFDYLLTEIPSDFGCGFLVGKVRFDGPAACHLNIDGARRTCECEGFNCWQKCKHSEGFAALVERGRI